MIQNGLTIRRQPDILTELRDSYLSRISSEIVFDSNTFFGEDTVIISEQIASLEQGIQAVYNSFDVTKAEGVSLDRLVELVVYIVLVLNTPQVLKHLLVKMVR